MVTPIAAAEQRRGASLRATGRDYRLHRAGNTDLPGYAPVPARGYREPRRNERVSANRASSDRHTHEHRHWRRLVYGDAAQTPVAAQTPAQNGQASPQKLTFDGDTALWTMAIKPDKTADFEKIMAKVRMALTKSSDPLRRQQAAGWKVMRMTQPLADGTVAYVHIVHPVVKDVDYAIMQTLYEAFPDERQALYRAVSRCVREERLARDRIARRRPLTRGVDGATRSAFLPRLESPPRPDRASSIRVRSSRGRQPRRRPYCPAPGTSSTPPVPDPW